ncbi:MAG: hypothetical protein ACRCXB_26815 [Aeromonadaceae bacterium]
MATVRAVTPRCPRDSTKMIKVTKADGVTYWTCPVCGFEDPILP